MFYKNRTFFTSKSISRVLSRIVIYLVLTLLQASSHQIRRRRVALTFCLGVAPDGVYIDPICHHISGRLLPYLFILTTSRQTFRKLLSWRLFSVALSLRFPSLDVIQHHYSMEPGLSSYAAFRLCYTRLSNLLLLYYTIFLVEMQCLRITVKLFQFSPLNPYIEYKKYPYPSTLLF